MFEKLEGFPIILLSRHQAYLTGCYMKKQTHHNNEIF